MTKRSDLRVLLPAFLLLSACGIVPGGTDSGTGPADMAGADLRGTGGVQAKFSSLYGDYLSNCKICHAPNAPGRTADIEKTLDFTSMTTAYDTIVNGKASGLVGNQMDCNSVPFIQKGAPDKSLLVASLDAATRTNYDNTQFPKCDATAISDMTVKVGMQPSAAFVTALKDWITANAPKD